MKGIPMENILTHIHPTVERGTPARYMHTIAVTGPDLSPADLLAALNDQKLLLFISPAGQARALWSYVDQYGCPLQLDLGRTHLRIETVDGSDSEPDTIKVTVLITTALCAVKEAGDE
jgi:hypothetical protein